ncbi:MAG: hypothetical protein ACI8XO_003185 [Verrucomicrobiales bacterium]|jgi:hypothetical protein
MKGFLQVLSLFGIPLAIVIWYDLINNTEGYQLIYTFKASRPLAIGIHLVTAFLCLHTPLRLWRNFNPMTLRLFCLTVSLAIFWIAVRLASSGRVEQAPILKSMAVFLIPIILYAALSHFLFKWSRDEFVDLEAETESLKKLDDTDGNS